MLRDLLVVVLSSHLDLLVAVRCFYSSFHLFVAERRASSLLSDLFAIVRGSHPQLLLVVGLPVCLLPLGLFARLLWSVLHHLFVGLKSDCLDEASGQFLLHVADVWGTRLTSWRLSSKGCGCWNLGRWH